MQREPVNILYVGLGIDNYNCWMGCASDFFEFGELLEEFGFSYTITALDREKKALERARIRDTIYRGNNVNMPINTEFLKKREAERVRFIEGDIVTLDPEVEEKYDIVHCLNVMLHLGSPENIIL